MKHENMKQHETYLLEKAPGFAHDLQGELHGRKAREHYLATMQHVPAHNLEKRTAANPHDDMIQT